MLVAHRIVPDTQPDPNHPDLLGHVWLQSGTRWELHHTKGWRKNRRMARVVDDTGSKSRWKEKHEIIAAVGKRQ
jgi:hypothetical protein